MTSTSPALTEAPAATFTSRMLPGIGALTSTAPAEAGAAGCGRSSSGSGSRSGLGCGCGSRSHGCSAGSGLLDRDAVSNAIDGNIVVLHGRVLLNQSRSLDVRFLTEPCCRASWAGGQRAWCSAARRRPRRLRGRWQPRRSCRQNRRPQQRQRCTPRRRRQQPWPW